MKATIIFVLVLGFVCLIGYLETKKNKNNTTGTPPEANNQNDTSDYIDWESVQP